MAKRCLLLLVATLSVAIPLMGCEKPDAAKPSRTVEPPDESARAGSNAVASTFGTDALVAAFSDAGLSARMRPSTGLSIFGSGAKRETLSIGTATVQVFVFANESVTKKAVAGVSSDGTSINRVSKSGVSEGGGMYEFIGRTHLYARDRVLVLFVESGPRPSGQPMRKQDERVIEVLESAMGTQFAGG
jgi:hypothetical protein